MWISAYIHTPHAIGMTSSERDKEINTTYETLITGQPLPRGGTLSDRKVWMRDSKGRRYWKVKIEDEYVTGVNGDMLRTIYKFSKKDIVNIYFVKLSTDTQKTVNVPMPSEIINVNMATHEYKRKVTAVIGDSFRSTAIVGTIAVR